MTLPLEAIEHAWQSNKPGDVSFVWQYVDQLVAEIRAYRSDRDFAEREHRDLVTRAEAAEAEVARLRAALAKYGQHEMGCDINYANTGPFPAFPPCTCGLDAAQTCSDSCATCGGDGSPARCCESCCWACAASDRGGADCDVHESDAALAGPGRDFLAFARALPDPGTTAMASDLDTLAGPEPSDG